MDLPENDIINKLTNSNSFVQSKEVYLEQIKLIRQLSKVGTSKNQCGTATSNQSNTPTTSSQSQCSTSQSSKNINIPHSNNLNTMAEKMIYNEPYNLFFTTIPESEKTLKQPNCITFTDLLCPSLGSLVRSLQINFMIDIEWLMKQYKKRNLHTKPLTILYGDEFPDMEKFMDLFLPQVTYKRVQMSDPFGCHHSKIGIYVYEDKSIRVVVSTANLYYEDWNHYNQGLWIGPALPRLPDNAKETDGESPTNFKKAFLFYLRHYKLNILKDWIEYVVKADFSAVKVCFVSSVPGKKNNNQIDGSHLRTVKELLTKHCDFIGDDKTDPITWPIIAQSSSLGTMGKTPEEWLRSTFLSSLASHKNAPILKNSQIKLCLIYPTMENVARGYFGADSGGCLPYMKSVHEKQLWLQQKFLQ